jgi:hypothetical protein
MTMNTGDVSRRIGVPITAELLQELGFTPTGKDKRAVLWDEDDYPAMCDALGRWIFGRKAMPMQPKPAAAPAKGKPKAGASKPADDDEEL